MTQYYSSIDHSDWSPIIFGAQNATKVQYGDGATDYSADRTAIVSDQSTISSAIMGTIEHLNSEDHGITYQTSWEGPSTWTDGGSVWTIDVGGLAGPFGDHMGWDAYHGGRLIGITSDIPVGDTIANGDRNRLFSAQAADTVSITKTYLSDYQTHLATIYGRISFPSWPTGDLGARAKSTLCFSHDLWHLWWDNSPPNVTQISNIQWGGVGDGYVVGFDMAYTGGTTGYKWTWAFKSDLDAHWVKGASNGGWLDFTPDGDTYGSSQTNQVDDIVVIVGLYDSTVPTGTGINDKYRPISYFYTTRT